MTVNANAQIRAVMAESIAELLSRPIPQRLWHYTSIQGFQDIVTSKRIFATELRYLNDRHEFHHLKLIADRIVEESPVEETTGLRLREALRLLVEATFDIFFDPNKFQIFVASFSAAEDLLSQWRGYSHGSTGVSVGFDMRSIRPPIGSETLVSFAPCVYEEPEQKALVRDAFNPFKVSVQAHWKNAYEKACRVSGEEPPLHERHSFVQKFFDKNPSEKGSREEFLLAVYKMRQNCFQLAALLKNPAFAEEREWRLVLPILLDPQKKLNNPPRFRVGRSTLLPYISHPFADTAQIVDVILGPGSDENSVFAAERFLMSEGTSVKPRTSSVPYRLL